MKEIDLRSDTVTRPTKGMLEVMMNAKVGDDVFGEDETVIALQNKVAKLFGKEAGLFCPSGTMTNQIAIKVHTQPGDELICDASAHIYNFETGGISFNSGVQARLVTGDRGRISAKQVEENINPDFDWLTRTNLVSIENTVNRAGGSFYNLKQVLEISSVCKKNNLPFHLDGARIFNALCETKDSTLDTGKHFDSISICLSKGLGAPVGSVLLGNKAFIAKAKRIRKVFGGGMRQAGFIAAAGIYALDHHIDRLKDDHKRAKELEAVLKNLSFIEEILPVETNIIIFKLNDQISSEILVQKLSEHGIKISAFGKGSVRLVTHLDFDDDMLNIVTGILKKI